MNTEEIKDTFAIQLASLDAFAKVLGYWRHPFSNSYHAAEERYGYRRGIKGCDTISFNKMALMHNSHWARFGSSWMQSTACPWFIVDVYTFNKAIAAKIVTRVKLQVDKKKKRIVCQNHLVNFAGTGYEQLYL